MQTEIEGLTDAAVKVTYEVLDGKGRKRASSEASCTDGVARGDVELKGARLWSLSDPYLYTLRKNNSVIVCQNISGKNIIFFQLPY